MGGEEDAHTFAGKTQENFKQLVAGNGVKAACGFVEDEQLRPVGKRQCKAVF